MFDLIIIGAGPAGITAAVYAVRKKIDTLVITKDIGGQAAVSGDIENYTGYQFITGPDLSLKFEQHMHKYKVKVNENEEVSNLKKSGDGFIVNTNKGTYQAKAIIVASGKRSQELNIPGEKVFKNKGVTYCATCDGPLFAQKDVAIIGGGNSALDAAMQMMNIAGKVYLININSEFSGDAIMWEKISTNDKVTIFNNSEIKAILGEKMVSEIKIVRAGKEENLSVQGVFVEIGLTPNSGFAGELAKNEFAEIKVNVHNETNLPGIFAAGDVTDVPEKQIIIACGEGAKACLSVFRYLSTRKL